MLLRIFRGTGPGVIVLVIITILFVWFSAIIDPEAASEFYYDSDPMPLYAILRILTGTNSLVGVLIAFSLVLLMLFLLVSFNTAVFFINERTFLPAITYGLLSGLFPWCQQLNPILPATVFLMLAVRKIMDSYRFQGVAYDLFDAGLLISTGSLFYADLIWFGVLIIVGIVLLRTANFREILISVLGMATPYVLTFGLYYVLGKDISSLISVIKYNLFASSPDYMFTRVIIAVLFILGLLILISVLHLLSLMNTKKIRSRKTFYLLMWVFFISAALYLVLPSVSVEIFWIAAIPVSYFMSHYFVFIRKKLVPELLFASLFILIALVQVLEII